MTSTEDLVQVHEDSPNENQQSMGELHKLVFIIYLLIQTVGLFYSVKS